jgi:hypothetical protein
VPDTPTSPPHPESWIPNDRYYVQLALGQVHGVLHVAVREASFWLPRSPDPGDVSLTVADLEAAYDEACRQVGTIQAALNTGAYDERLPAVGFTGGQLIAKLKGLAQSIQKYGKAAKNSVVSYLSRMQPALGWCGTIVGSVSVALQKEIDKIPGASAAAEGLKEFIEVLQNAAESAKTNAPTAAPTSSGGWDEPPRNPERQRKG